ncbi:hypothetical protein DFS34DRAFT_285915 [Phlyctochytrium arcticum]|nr:hypothetical protein DFS34DRAFT_285915 [Phlyctochytrium arcticum]
MSGRPRTPSGASAPPTLDTRPSGYQHRKSLSTSSAGSGGPGGVGAPSSPRPEVRRARALWDYHAIEGNELSFKAGAIISIIELCNDDWYEGQVGDKCGFFPANRVELLKRDITKQPPVGGIRIPSPTPGSPSSSGTPARQNSQSRPTSPLKTAFAAPAISEMSPVATTSSSQFAVDMRSPSPARSEVNPFGDDAAISDSSMSEGLSQGVRERVRDTSQATKPANRFGKSDWETVINTQGQAYFWNRNTGETSWGSPVTSASQRSQSPQMQPLDLNQGSLATAAAERAQSVHRRNTSGSVKGDLLTDLAKVIDRFDSTSVVSQVIYKVLNSVSYS